MGASFKKGAIEQLQEIINKDYGLVLSTQETIDFGTSLLRLSKMARVALARADEKDSSIQARGRHPLEANTSK